MRRVRWGVLLALLGCLVLAAVAGGIYLSRRPAPTKIQPRSAAPAQQTVQADALPATFSDVPGSHWAHSAVERVVEAGLVQGMGDGTFAVESVVNYAAVCAMFYQLFYADYPLYDTDTWFLRYITCAQVLGVLDGTQVSQENRDGTPWTALALRACTRYDMAQMIYNVATQRGWEVSPEAAQQQAQAAIFGWEDIPDRVRPAVAYCHAAGFLNVLDSRGHFYGQALITRGAAAQVLCRLLDAAGQTHVFTPLPPEGGKAAVLARYPLAAPGGRKGGDGRAAAPAEADARARVALPVIMYHSVDALAQNEWSISPAEFEADLQYLRENGYQTVLIADLVAYVNGVGALPEKPVLLTFDDGYANNYETMYPLLERYDACAVVSVIGGMIAPVQPGRSPSGSVGMDWGQVAALAANAHIEIGHHTWDLHTMEPGGRRGCAIMKGEDVTAYQQMLADDITQLQEKLTQVSGSSAVCFAYPYGRRCKEAAVLIQEMGFQASLLTWEGCNTIVRGQPDSLHGLLRYNRPPGYSIASILRRAEKSMR